MKTTPAPASTPAPEGVLAYEAALERVRAELAAAIQAQRSEWAPDLAKLAADYFDH